MRKNKMMRLASMLLVLCLLTTSVISGTFAKYTTQDSADDTARVAKWGVELQVEGNLFGDSYKDNIVISKNDTDDTITVQAVDYAAGGENDVVAPGTENPNGFTFSLKGKPEVDGEVTTEMKIQNVFLKAASYGVMLPVKAGVVTAENFDEFEDDLWIKTGEYSFEKATAFKTNVSTYYTLEDAVTLDDNYYPLKYNLAGSTSYVHPTVGATKTDSLKGAADKIAAQLGLEITDTADDTTLTYTGTKAFQSNFDLEDWKVNGLTLTWEWKFEADDKEGDEASNSDKADTILGLLDYKAVNNTKDGTVVKKQTDSVYTANIVEYKDYCLDTQFSIDITATQVD